MTLQILWLARRKEEYEARERASKVARHAYCQRLLNDRPWLAGMLSTQLRLRRPLSNRPQTVEVNVASLFPFQREVIRHRRLSGTKITFQVVKFYPTVPVEVLLSATLDWGLAK